MRESEDELRFHLEMRVEEYMGQGMSEEEARRAAQERMGDLDRVRDELEELSGRRQRRERRREWFGDLVQDVRYGLRTLLRTPGFTAMAVLTLALGIGATTAIFSLVQTVLLAPLPYAQPDRLVRVWETSPQGADRNVVSPGNVRDWQERARSFEVLGAHRGSYPRALTGDPEAEARQVATVEIQPEVLRLLSVPPVAGRTLVQDDAVEGNVALVSEGLWRSRWGADPAVVDRPVVLNDVTYTVVGVMPAGFGFPSEDIDFWLPLTDESLDPEERTSHNFMTVARLAPGATVEGAQREMTRIASQIAAEHPAEMTGWSARVVPLHEDLTRNVRSLFWVLMAGVGVVLLIACGNLANLLLARAVSREREMALRGALGAGRGRILQQLFTESALLAGLGGIGAAIVAPFGLRLLVDRAPSDIPLLDTATIDGGLLLFTAAVALGSALLFGLAPALHLSGTDLETALRTGRGGPDSGSNRLRSVLMAGQVALSVVLLIGAGLFVRSFQELQRTDVGFSPEGLVVMEVDLPFSSYPEVTDQVVFYEELLERIDGIPGIRSVAASTGPPGSQLDMTFSFAIEGRPADSPNGREDDESLVAVFPGYFETVGQRVVRGRSFDARDRSDGQPVVIINESLARKHWPEGGAVGERIAFRVGETPWREIVGVVQDARTASPDQEPGPRIFIPNAQRQWAWLTWTGIVARAETGVDPLALGEAMRGELLSMAPNLPPQRIGTVEAAFRENTARRTFAMTLVTGFGLLALVLSVVGLYGLFSYSVARRRREIGVRIALGAERGRVVGDVLKRALALTGAGAAGGLVAALFLSRLLESLLYGVSPVDGTAYLATVVLVGLVALATAALPAIRAARTNPVETLGGE
jgi:predicted permease